MSASPDDAPLTAATVLPYLASRGIEVAPDARVEELSGGVSSQVLAVDDGERALVVKRSRSALQVAEEWLAPRERTLTEGSALELAAQLRADWSPPLLDLDADTLTLTMGRAPQDWRTWKELLLAGEALPELSGRLGRLLAAWHDAAAFPEARDGRFDQQPAFEALRVTPYYRVTAQRNADVAAVVEGVVARMADTRDALVHGDFSPKNVLVGAGGAWVIDFEVVHLGDASFDVAFLLNHLALKALRRPAAAPGYRLAADAFLNAYETVRAPFERERLLRQLGCLMLARVDGVSPVEYLDEAQRRAARALAKALLRDELTEPADVWASIDDLKDRP